MVAGACAYAFDIHGLVVFGIVNALIAFVLYHQMPHILSLVSEAATAEKKAHPGEVRTNDWSAFARLSVVIFVRSIGFTVCNTFIPLYWIHVLHASPQRAVWPCPSSFPWASSSPSSAASWQTASASSASFAALW